MRVKPYNSSFFLNKEKRNSYNIHSSHSMECKIKKKKTKFIFIFYSLSQILVEIKLCLEQNYVSKIFLYFVFFFTFIDQ